MQRAYSLTSPSWQFEDSYRVLERLLSLSDAAPLGRAQRLASLGLAAVARCLDWLRSYKSARAQKRAAGIPAELLLQL
jgi:hypothetical protein